MQSFWPVLFENAKVAQGFCDWFGGGGGGGVRWQGEEKY